MRPLVKTLSASAAAVAGLLMVTASPAQASSNDDANVLLACQSYDTGFKFKLYYNSNTAGAYRDFGYAVGNFDSVPLVASDPVALKFCSGTGAGAGQRVKNNAASAHNRHTSYGACVYYNSWFNGAKDTLQPATPVPVSRNLVNTYNENASFQWC
jgi:hypothetical protein